MDNQLRLIVTGKTLFCYRHVVSNCFRRYLIIYSFATSGVSVALVVCTAQTGIVAMTLTTLVLSASFSASSLCVVAMEGPTQTVALLSTVQAFHQLIFLMGLVPRL